MFVHVPLSLFVCVRRWQPLLPTVSKAEGAVAHESWFQLFRQHHTFAQWLCKYAPQVLCVCVRARAHSHIRMRKQRGRAVCTHARAHVLHSIAVPQQDSEASNDSTGAKGGSEATEAAGSGSVIVIDD